MSPSPERHIRPVIAFPILDVQRDDARVMFAEEGDRVEIGGREVADVEIHRDLSVTCPSRA